MSSATGEQGESKGESSLHATHVGAEEGSTPSSEATTSTTTVVSTEVVLRLLKNASRLWDSQQELNQEDLETLAAFAHNCRVPEGQCIVKQDDQASFVTLVIAGEAHVVVKGSTIAVIGAGSVIGAQSFLSQQKKRNADVFAGQGLILSVLQYDMLTSMSEDYPLLYCKIFKILCLESMSAFTRQAIDQEASKVQLFDETIRKNDSIRRELSDLVSLGSKHALEGKELPEIPPRLLGSVPSLANATGDVGSTLLSPRPSDEESTSKTKKPLFNAVEKNKLEIFIKSQMLQSKKVVDRLYEEEKHKVQRTEAQLRSNEHKIALMSAEIARFKEIEARYKDEIDRFTKENSHFKHLIEVKDKEATSAQNERDYLQGHLAKVGVEFKNLKSVTERLKEENELLKNDLTAAEKTTEGRVHVEREKVQREKKREMIVVLRAIEQSTEKYEEERRSKNEVIEELEETKKMLEMRQVDTERLKQRHKDAITSLEKELQDSNRRANELHRALMTTVMERDDALTKVEKMSRSVATVVAEKDVLKDNLSHFRGLYVRAKAQMKIVVNVCSHQMIMLFGKMLVTKKRLAMVYEMVRDFLSHFVSLAKEEESAESQLQADIEQYELLREYKKVSKMKIPMVELCEDIMEAMQLAQPFVRFIASNNKKHKTTSNAFFNRSIELSAAYTSFLKDAEMKSLKRIQSVNEVEELRGENAALMAQNQALRMHVTQLMQRQLGQGFVPSSSLSLALSSLQGHVEAKNWPEKKYPVVPNNGIVDPSLKTHQHTAVQILPLRPSSAMPKLRGRAQSSFLSSTTVAPGEGFSYGASIAPPPLKPLPPKISDAAIIPPPPPKTLLVLPAAQQQQQQQQQLYQQQSHQQSHGHNNPIRRLGTNQQFYSNSQRVHFNPGRL